MGLFIKVISAIEKVHTVPQMARNCGPGVGFTGSKCAYVFVEQ